MFPVDTVQTGRQTPTFRRNTLSSSSEQKRANIDDGRVCIGAVSRQEVLQDRRQNVINLDSAILPYEKKHPFELKETT